MAIKIFESSLSFIESLRDSRELDAQEAERNPYLAEALEREKYEGHRLATFARTVALTIIAVLLPILTPRVDMLFYVGVVLLFIALGWLQLWAARVGQSGRELMLIFADLILLTIVFTVPNPFLPEDIPTVFVYQFDNFVYFFVFLALGMLAYSWRTVWSMGIWIAVCWMVAMAAVAIFGRVFPQLSEASARIYADHSLLGWALDPNRMLYSERIEEAIVVVMVGMILGLKGARSNRLLIQQASIAAERANLSRYFPSSLVETLASTDHDIGAVRN
ncbi:MAG: adenylate/guanylate cyclase domain-containing protein, partial [Rhizobiaceae bacterium]